jgi:hypothetical protein
MNLRVEAPICWLLIAGYILDFFRPDEGSSKILLNVRKLISDYTVSVLFIQGVSRRSLQWYSKCYCVAIDSDC